MIHRATLLSILLGTTALATAQAPLIKKLQTHYDAMSAAFAANKPDVFDSFLSKDYLLVQPGGRGKWDRKHVLDDFKRQMTRMKNAKWERHVRDVKVAGNTATVTVDGKFKGAFDMGDGKPHIFELTSLATDVWTVSPAGDKLSKSVIQRLDPLIDGKVPKM